MKIQYIEQDVLDQIKTNLPAWAENFKKDSSDWMLEVLGCSLFQDSEYKDVPDFSLLDSEPDPQQTDSENVKRFYRRLRFISQEDAVQEQLWAALCLGPFWNYVKYRCGLKENCTPSNIRQHFFFAEGPRRSLLSNSLARLWWIGRLTYDSKRQDPWELTKFVCDNSGCLTRIFEGDLYKNHSLIRAFLSAIFSVWARGVSLPDDKADALVEYLNLLGGITILDRLSEKIIFEKVSAKTKELAG